MLTNKSFTIVDTETTTHNFIRTIAKTDKEQTLVSTARPLVYHMGWVNTNENGDIVSRRNFIPAEIYYDTALMDVAYYGHKRPMYDEGIKSGEFIVASWNAIISQFIEDIEITNGVCAYNANFDLYRAIPYTEEYICAKKQPSFDKWMALQEEICGKMIAENISPAPSFYAFHMNEIDDSHFYLRGKTYPIVDLWAMACESILDCKSYRNACLSHEMLTNSGEFFKTSAETAFRFLTNNYSFIEDHTALSDSEVEEQILMHMINKGIPLNGVKCFPFRSLGTTDKYILDMSNPPKKWMYSIKKQMEHYTGKAKPSSYRTKIQNKIFAIDNRINEKLSAPSRKRIIAPIIATEADMEAELEAELEEMR